MFPDSWKSARVAPIFKNGERDDRSNYRPISFLPVLSRRFEEPVYDQRYNVCQKSLEHLYSVRNFQPPSYFHCKNDNSEPLPASYNVESMAEALSYLERHHFSLQCYSYHLQTTLFYGAGDFVVHLQHKSQELFQDFWQTLYNHLNKNKHLYEFNLVFELCTQLRRPY